jgi:hypothetical protein
MYNNPSIRISFFGIPSGPKMAFRAYLLIERGCPWTEGVFFYVARL